MKVLVVEKTSGEQAATARRLESIDRIDKDTLDLSLSLSDDTAVLERAAGCDVILIGASIGEYAHDIVRRAKSLFPQIDILRIVSNQSYSSGAFRSAFTHGARKVFAESAPVLDIVQELMSIREQARLRKNTRPSRVIAVMQAKGGVGTTSACAALAEVCAQYGQSTILWDLDIETRDLCRALMVEGEQPTIVREFIQGEREVSRESLRQALMPVSDLISILPPPDHMGACIDYVGCVDRLDTIQSIVDLSRITHDNIIIDLGGRIGPAAAAIMRSADAVVVMLDDSLLGLSAVRFFLPTLRSVVKNPDSIYFLCSGIAVPQSELARQIEQGMQLGSHAWSLPSIPFDAAAAKWAGSGSTMYNTGKRQTQRIFERIAAGLNLIEVVEPHAEAVRLSFQLFCRPALSALTAALVVGFVSLFSFLWHRV